MDMSEKNGQPSMEEILASIRRIIAEEPGDALSAEAMRMSGGSIALDEAGEFELPSMFRGAPAQDKSAATPSRLADALRSANQSAQGDASQAGDAYNAAAAAQAAQAAGLSSLKPVRNETPQAAPGWNPSAGEQSPQAASFNSAFPMPPSASAAGVKREMVAFKDTRFARMMNAASAPPPAADASRSPVNFASIIPGQMERVGGMLPTSPPPVTAQPPRPASPVGNPAQMAPVDPAAGGMEDSAAELLRPMLRQWLSENMPRMVEKALHIEVAESVKTGSKPPKQ